MGPKENSVNLIFSLLKDVLVTQEKQKNSIENKASTLLAFAAGLLGLLTGAYNTIKLFPLGSQVTIIVAIVFLAISILLATMAGSIRKYRIDPNPEILASNYLNKHEEETQLQLISNWISAWKTNTKIIEEKATLLRVAFVAQTIAFLLLGTALFQSIFD